MLCGLLRNPGLGINPQVEILGGDGVSVRKVSALAVSSGAPTPPDDWMAEEEDREVTSASGEVCTLGVSTAKSASMRKFLDFSILPPLRVLFASAAVNEGEVRAVFPPLKSYVVVRSVSEELSVTLNPRRTEAIGAAVRGVVPSAVSDPTTPPALITVKHSVGRVNAFIKYCYYRK